jgi:putative peptidoglycan lipid II flippase
VSGGFHWDPLAVIPRSRILRDTAHIGVLTTLVKVAGAAKMVVIARYLGAGEMLDAYLMAFLVPSFVGDSLSGAITQALLPTLVHVRKQGSEKEAERLYSGTLLGSTGLLLITAIMVAWLNKPLLRMIAPGFNDTKIDLTSSLLLIMLPILPLSAIGVTWRTLLNAQERFAIAALVPLLTPLTIIAAVTLFGRGWSVYSIAAGTVTGATLEVVVLGIALWNSGAIVFPRWGGYTGATRKVVRQYGSVAASNLITAGSSVVDQIMASLLIGGSVSALNYGTRLVSVLLAIGPAALGTAILPRFSRMAAAEDWRGLQITLKKYALLCVIVTLPITVILIALSQPVIRIAFERGAFTSADTHTVALVQAFALVQLPFSFLLTLLVRIASALTANHLLLWISIAGVALNVLLDVVLMRWLGVAGIALSTAAVHAFAAACLTYFLRRRMRENLTLATSAGPSIH